MVVIALTFLLPPWAGLVALAPRSSLNLVGAALAIIGVAGGVAVNALTGFTLYVATDPHLAARAGQAFTASLWHDHVIAPLFVAYLMLPVATLITAAALLRARVARWWESITWAIGLLAVFFTSGGPIGAAAAAALLAGSFLLSKRLHYRINARQ